MGDAVNYRVHRAPNGGSQAVDVGLAGLAAGDRQAPAADAHREQLGADQQPDFPLHVGAVDAELFGQLASTDEDFRVEAFLALAERLADAQREQVLTLLDRRRQQGEAPVVDASRARAVAHAINDALELLRLLAAQALRGGLVLWDG